MSNLSASFGRTLRRWAVDHGRENALRMADEAIATNKINRNSLSLRGMAQGILGDEWEDKLRAYAANPIASMLARGTENADAVDASTFAAITGNQLITTIREKYKNPEFIGDQLCTTIPVTNGNLDTQKEPWLSDVDSTSMSTLADIDDEDEDQVQAGMPYNRTKFSPNYVLLARPKKSGRICDVTFEMIYADRTRQAYDSATSVAKRLGRRKEYRILKAFLGISVSYTFSFGGAAEAASPTYVTTNTSTTNAAGNRWVNSLNSQPLRTWADLNAAEQLFAQMRDPVTDEPIDIDADMIFVMPANLHNAKHVVHATGLRVGPGGSTATSNAPLDTVAYTANDLKSYNILTSKYAYKLATTSGVVWPAQDYTDDATTLTATAAQVKDLWFMGNPKAAIYYREVFPLRVVQAPPMNPEEFNRDVVLSVKASEYGVAGVRDPRYLVRAWGHAFETQTD